MTLFILAVIGLTHILVASEIVDPVDDWAKTWMPPKVIMASLSATSVQASGAVCCWPC